MENEEILWWKEDNKDLKKIYPLIGEYQVSFNYLVYEIEDFVLELNHRYKRGYSSRASGAYFNSPNREIEPLTKIFDDESKRLLDSTPHIKSLKTLKKAESERKKIVKHLDIVNTWRNFYTHAFWHTWEKENPYISKSIPANQRRGKKVITSSYGRTGLLVPVEDLKRDIHDLDNLSDRIFCFQQKYQYGDGLPEEKLSKARAKQLEVYRSKWVDWSERKFKNLGVDDILWLERLEIFSNEELRKKGAKKTYMLLIKDGHIESKRLLFSLIGSVLGRDWREVSKEIRIKRNI